MLLCLFLPALGRLGATDLVRTLLVGPDGVTTEALEP